MTRRLARDVIGAQLWQGAILCCTVAVQLAAARFMGPSALGVTAIIVSGSSLCVLLIELNLQSALVRAVSIAGADERLEVRRDTLEGRLQLALLLAPLIALGTAWSAGHNQLTLFVGILGAVLAQELNPGWWLQGIGEAGRSFKLAGAVALAAAVLALPVVFGLRQPASENLIASLAAILIYAAFWRKAHGFPHFGRHCRERVGRYLVFAWRNRSFLIGGAAVYLYLYPAQLMLAYMRGTEEAGLYRVAMMPGTAYYIITVAAFNAYYPQVVRALTEGIPDFERTLRSVAFLVTAAGLVAWVVTLSTLGLFALAVGKGFDLAITLAPALVISKVIGGLVLVARAGLLAKGREQFVYVTYVCVGLLSLALGSILIPRYGLLGAAGVEIGAETLHGLLLLFALANLGWFRRITPKLITNQSLN